MKTQTLQKNVITLLSTFCILSTSVAIAQNIGINGTGANAHPSALLDVDAAGGSSRGLLVPRVAITGITDITTIATAANSLLIYNTTTANTGTNAVAPGYYYWDVASTQWVRFAYNAAGSSSNNWNLLGNAGTTTAINFLGTTDAQDLVFRTNNIEKIRVLTNGNVGIGISVPVAKLDVVGNLNVTQGYYYGGVTSPANIELIRAVPTTINDFIEIGNFNLGNGAHNFRISATSSIANSSEAKTYIVSTLFHQTGATWQQLNPISNTGPYNFNDFELDINVTNSICYLRLRKTAGAVGGNAQIRIENTGSILDQFTPTSAIGSTSTPTIVFLITPPSIYSANWSLIGNAGTNPTTNFLGTTDAKDVVFRTNNLENIRIQNVTGNVQIGPPAVGSLDHRVRVSADLGSNAANYTLVGQHYLQFAVSRITDKKEIEIGMTDDGIGIIQSHERGIGYNSLSLNPVNGNVGVGTTTPQALFNINGDGYAKGIRLGGTNPNTSYVGDVYSDWSNTRVNGGAGNALVIESKGDVDLRNTLTTNNGSGRIIFRTGAGTVAGGTGQIHDRMIVDHLGNVGIGISLPTDKLSVAGRGEFATSINDHGLRIRADGTNAQSILQFTDAAASIQWASIMSTPTGGGDLIFNTNLNPQTILTGAGRFGLGTLTPTEKLEVQGSVKIVDGTQGLGKVLGSDAAGKASWVTLSPIANAGTVPTSDLSFTADALYHYIGYSVVVPPGRSNVSVGVFIQCPTMNYFTCRLSTSNTVATYTGGSYLPFLCAVSCNPNYDTAIGTLLYYVNNTSGSPQTLYVWGIPASAANGNACLIRGSSTAAEPYILSAY